MEFAREMGERITAAAQGFPAVVLTGARQTGKTTLLRTLFPDHTYVSLDLPSEAADAEHAPEAFLARHPAPVVIDEVQYAPGLFRHLKVAIDAHPRSKGQYILTGSQKFTLMQGVAESLAGRAAVLELDTLSTTEIGAAPSRARELAHVAATLARGFYTALWESERVGTHDFYASYLATYLERDLRQLVNVSDLRTFERFLRLCAVRSAQLLNKTDLARDAGISTKTATAWLSALEASNQLSLVPPFHANVGKRLIKTPKLFVNDTGMLVFLLGLDAHTFADSPLAGAIWETAVFGELRKAIARQTTRREVFVYREHDGGEVDFIVTGGGSALLFECKWTELPRERDALGVERVADALAHDPLHRPRGTYVVCRTPNSFPLTPRTRAVHGFQLAPLLAPPARGKRG